MSLVVTPAPIEAVDAEKRGLEPRRFRPRLSFGYHQDLQALIRDLSGLAVEDSIHRIRACIDTAEAGRAHLRHLGVHSDDLQPTIVYLASLRVLRDLVLQGWTPGSDDDGIYILPPSLTAAGDDPAEAKSDLRNSFRFALADQLLSPSVAAFVRRMEQQGIAAVTAAIEAGGARGVGVEADLADPTSPARIFDAAEAALTPVSIGRVRADPRSRRRPTDRDGADPGPAPPVHEASRRRPPAAYGSQHSRLDGQEGRVGGRPETDSSGARFVTRSSVEAAWMARQERRKPTTAQAAVAVAEVARFTGHTSAELVDLVKAGVLQQVPGRRQLLLTAASLRAWMAEGDSGHSGLGTVAGGTAS
jgi:hypothetical protein